MRGLSIDLPLAMSIWSLATSISPRILDELRWMVQHFVIAGWAEDLRGSRRERGEEDEHNDIPNKHHRDDGRNPYEGGRLKGYAKNLGATF